MVKEMPKIKSCEETDCSYNKHNSCHAFAITVGGEESCPMCDTYLSSPKRGGIVDVRGGVGACKVSSCSHNDSFECGAATISIAKHKGHPDCMTFHKR